VTQDTRHPELSGGEMDRTWRNWTDCLFQKGFKLEIQKMDVLTQTFYETLIQRLTQ
jgi:hypothetical protein